MICNGTRVTVNRLKGGIEAFMRRNTTAASLLRFGAVGLLTTGIYLVGTYLLNRFGSLSMPLATSISYALAAALNYALHYSWTFRSDRPHASALPRFFGTAGCGAILNYATVTLSQNWLALPKTSAVSVGVGVVLLWNYLIGRFWVFVQRRQGARQT